MKKLYTGILSMVLVLMMIAPISQANVIQNSEQNTVVTKTVRTTAPIVSATRCCTPNASMDTNQPLKIVNMADTTDRMDENRFITAVVKGTSENRFTNMADVNTCENSWNVSVSENVTSVPGADAGVTGRAQHQERCDAGGDIFGLAMVRNNGNKSPISAGMFTNSTISTNTMINGKILT